jgi:hypothetical protein
MTQDVVFSQLGLCAAKRCAWMKASLASTANAIEASSGFSIPTVMSSLRPMSCIDCADLKSKWLSFSLGRLWKTLLWRLRFPAPRPA